MHYNRYWYEVGWWWWCFTATFVHKVGYCLNIVCVCIKKYCNYPFLVFSIKILYTCTGTKLQQSHQNKSHWNHCLHILRYSITGMQSATLMYFNRVHTHFDISDSRTFQCQIQGPFQWIHKLLTCKDTSIFQKCEDWISICLWLEI